MLNNLEKNFLVKIKKMLGFKKKEDLAIIEDLTTIEEDLLEEIINFLDQIDENIIKISIICLFTCK